MEINTCPECAAETMVAGFALWAEGDTAVMVITCSEPECGWATVESELGELSDRVHRERMLAA